MVPSRTIDSRWQELTWREKDTGESGTEQKGASFAYEVLLAV